MTFSSFHYLHFSTHIFLLSADLEFSKKEFFAQKRAAFLYPNDTYPRSKSKGVFPYN
nr:MAG TPA: hypothetical protein [Caudoviricetes sp.]